MQRRVQAMIMGLGFMLMGCAGGVQDLGTMQLPDGQTVYATQFRTKEHGPEIIAVEMFTCTKPVPDHPTVCEPYMHMHSSGNSGGVALFNGAGTAAVGALSLGLPAHLTRPATSSTTMEQQGGAVTSGSSSGSESSSVSKAVGGQGGIGVGGQGGVGLGGTGLGGQGGHGGAGGQGGQGTSTSQSAAPATFIALPTPAPMVPQPVVSPGPHGGKKHLH